MDFTIEESTTEKVSPMLYEIIKGILSQSNASDSTQKDFLFILIVVLMIENGFFPKKNDSELINSANNIGVEQLTQWKSPAGLMEAAFAMNGFESIPLKLIMSPLGSTSIVNLVISDLNSETYSVCLPVSRYVVSPQASTIPMIFRDLKHLSITFKNKVLSAVKSRILSYCGYPSASLLGLPEEVLLKIILHLPITDVVKVSKTCKRLKFLMENQCMWHELFKRDFKIEGQSIESDWKELYRAAYTRQQDNNLRQSSRAAGAMHDYMDYSDLISYIDNPMWDIII